MADFKYIKKLYDELKAEREKYRSRWEKLSKYVGIKSPVQNGATADKQPTEDKDLDKYTYDPTAALSVQQSSDYLKGIVWGNGENIFTLEPSDEVLDMADIDEVKDWYAYATEKTLYQMNHPESGLDGALAEYFYDQKWVGTSGLGCFQNAEFKNGTAENALLFRAYGVDTMCIDEGKNGLVEVVFNTYNWRVNRIVQEFCSKKKGFDMAQFNKLPERIRNDYKAGNMNNTHTIVNAVLPSDMYDPTGAGRKKAKYIGYWFSADATEKDDVFFTEYFNEKPICVGREEKVRGEIYGRSSGSMLISTIECVNEGVAGIMETLDKMNKPPVGIYGDSLFGDSVVDTSANALTIFNANALNGLDPIVKMQDIGDPSGLINFLLPYLNEKISTAFKIDILLDFSAKSNMTATESMQRYAIRGRSLSGLIVRHKTEVIDPIINRSLSILWDLETLGYKSTDTKAVEDMKKAGKVERIIPDAVVKAKNEGKRWYKIRYNNDIEKLTRVEVFEDLTKEINIITALMSVYPDIAEAVNWHKLLADASDAMGFKDLIISEKNFKDAIKQKAEAMAQMQQAQVANMQSQTNKNNAGAINEFGKSEQTGQQ